MGCANEYLNPDALEKHSRNTARLLNYATNALMAQGASNVSPLEDWVKAASMDPYGNKARADELTAALCDLINGMTDDQQTSILYDGRDSDARDLATWWADHQRVDAERDAGEKHEARMALVAGKIINLLNAEGKEAMRWAYGKGLLN